MSSVDEYWSNELVLAEALEKCQGINDMAMINGKQVSRLMVACLHGNPDYVKDLLEAPGVKIDLQNKEGQHALMFACSCLPSPEVAEVILKSCGQHAQQLANLANYNGSTPLMAASFNGHTKMVSLLLEYGADINARNKDGSPALMAACLYAHSQNGAHVKKAQDERSTLSKEMYSAEIETVELLLKNNARVDMQNEEGQTPLMMASLQGHTETVSLLLQNGANVNLCNKKGRTSLIYACGGGHMETALLLLQSGANINQLDAEGRSPLMISTSNGFSELVSILPQYGANVNQQDQEGYSPLMVASLKGYTDIVSLLLQSKADINMQRIGGQTSLMIAIIYKHAKVVSKLLENGADVNIRGEYGRSPLANASWCLPEVVPLLLQHGAIVDMPDQTGSSPLIIASQNRDAKTASLLIQGKANVDLQSTDGLSPLLIAVFFNYPEIVSLLLQKYADINNVRFEGNSPLMMALLQNNTEVAKLLMDRNASVDIISKHYDSALTLATQHNQVSLVQSMINRKLEEKLLDHQDKFGNSSLMIASSNGYIEIARILLKAGAKVNISNFTFFHQQIELPIESVDIDSFESDLYKADYSSFHHIQVKRHKVGCSALDMAVVKGHEDLVSLLLDNGASVSNVLAMIEQVILRLATEKYKSTTQSVAELVSTCSPNDTVIQSPLSFSDVWKKYHSVFQLLFSHDKDLISRILCTQPPSTLYMACAFGVLEVVV